MQTSSRPKGVWAPDQCFTLLEQNGPTTTGIFRVSAPKLALDIPNGCFGDGKSVAPFKVVTSKTSGKLDLP